MAGSTPAPVHRTDRSCPAGTELSAATFLSRAVVQGPPVRADAPRVSDFDPTVQPRAVNQFGTPVGYGGAPSQFATPPSAGQPPFGTPVPAGGWASPAPVTPPRRSGAAVAVAVLAALAVLVVGGIAVRTYVFPDLGKPIDLPATVAGVPMSSTAPLGSAVQGKDPEGRALAVSVYADTPARPHTMIVVSAQRRKLTTDRSGATATTAVGKVTCSNDLDAAAMLGQSPAAAQLAAMKLGAVCWRTGRHLTVTAVVVAAAGSAQVLGAQAVNVAWDAI